MVVPLGRIIKLGDTGKDMTNHDVTFFLDKRLAADKAVLALVILREERKPDAVGVGPNRDDAKMFTGIAKAYVEGKAIPKEVQFQSRHRVRKYARQLRESKFYTALMDSGIGVDDFVKRYADACAGRVYAETLATEMKTVRGYGDW